MACLENLIDIIFFCVGLAFKGAFSFCDRCPSPCRTEERRRQYLVGGYHAIFL